MTELSFAARLLLSVALTALSLAVWKWLQAPAKPPQQGAKRDKKRSKKRSAKKSAKPDASSSSPPPSSSQERPQQPTTQLRSLAQTSIAKATATANAAATANPGESEDSDSDEGLSAAQVLATRKFKPKNLGGSRLARRIQAALPTADAPRFAVSQEVLARFEGGARWLPATVLEVGVSIRCNPQNGTRHRVRKGNEYHLKYDDGEIEYRVPAALLKPRPTATVSEDEGKTQPSVHSGQVSELRTDVLGLLAAEAASSSGESDDDDGWQVVGGSSRRRPPPPAAAEPLVGGLTKRQRESRRKKERQRELKELLRLQAQRDDVDARARMRYVPPPPAPPS
ncbi:hypothetical protein BBJ28_00014195 [Nothophytophthora sp. Chile5]|nr:hypothetical protein BBJ28_00014195 [Nothophytophthora sp. Chile5]